MIRESFFETGFIFCRFNVFHSLISPCVFVNCLAVRATSCKHALTRDWRSLHFRCSEPGIWDTAMHLDKKLPKLWCEHTDACPMFTWG